MIYKRHIEASFTLEAAILVPIFLLIIVLSVRGAISLYDETLEMTTVTENLKIDQVNDFRLYAFGEDITSLWKEKGEK